MKMAVEVQQILGIGSGRHVSCLVATQGGSDEPYADVAAGPCVARWELKRGKPPRRHFLRQLHQSVVTSLRAASNGLIVTTSEYAELSLRQPNSYSLLCSATAVPQTSIVHSAWSYDSRWLATCARDRSGLVIWKVNYRQDNEDKPLSLCPAAQVDGDIFEWCEYNREGHVVTATSKNGEVLVLMYNSSGHVLKTQVLESCTRATITCMCPHPHLELVGIALSNRKVYILDKLTLSVLSVITTTGSGRLYSFLWASSGSIICHSDDGRLSLWNDEGKLRESSAVAGVVYHMSHWKTDALLLHTVSGLFIVTFLTEGNPGGFTGDSRLLRTLGYANEPLLATVVEDATCIAEIEYHKTACCGLSLSFRHSLCACGDLSGACILWNLTPNNEVVFHEPLALRHFSSPVRCTSIKDDTVFIGCLDGTLYCWKFSTGAVPEGPPRPEYRAPGGITSMMWSSGKFGVNLLALGTDEGTLVLLRLWASKQIFGVEHFKSFRAHLPGKSSEQFGSLHKYCEIWSLCWSPEDQYLATAAEDQTCRIWDCKNWQCVLILKRHESAVFSTTADVASSLMFRLPA